MPKLFFVVLLFASTNILIAQKQYNLPIKNQSLDKALELFSNIFKTSFAYDIGLTKNIFVDCIIDAASEEMALTQLLGNTGFQFKRINTIYVIQPIDDTKHKKILSGIVRDAKSGKKLPYASIAINNPSVSTISNVDGSYSIQLEKIDTVEIIASYLGYQSKIKKVSWRNIEKTCNFDLVLKPALLNEVIIKAGSNGLIDKTNNSSDYSINMSKAGSLPNAGEPDIFSTLKFIPGINSTNESQSGLVIRGQPSEYNMVLLDGIPLYHIDHFFGTFSAINHDAVQKIQLYKSAAEAKYGNRANSFIEVIGSKGSLKKASASLNLNMLSSSVFFETPIIKDKLSVLLAARRSYTDIIKSSIYQRISDSYLSNKEETTYLFGAMVEDISNSVVPDFYYHDLNAKILWKLSEKESIALSYYYGHDYYNVTNEYDAIFNIIKTDYSLGWGNQGASLKWDRQWNTRLFSETNVVYSIFDSQKKSSSLYTNKSTNLTDTIYNKDRNSIQDVSVYCNNQYLYNSKHQFGFGGYFSKKNVNHKIGEKEQINEQTFAKSNEYAAYIQDIYSPFNKLSINLGFRLSFYENVEKFYAEPRIKLKYRLVPTLVFKLSAARQNQFINKSLSIDQKGNTGDLWVLADDADIPVISANHYSGGATWKYKSWIVDFELYNLDFFGVTAYQIPAIYLNYSPSVYYTGESNSKGLDVFIQHSGEILNTSIGYSYATSNQNFENLANGKWFPTVNDQKHELKIIQNIKLRNWEFVATWLYGSGKPYTFPRGFYTIGLIDGSKRVEIDESNKNNYRLDAFHRLDFSINYFMDISKLKINLGLSFMNVYNRMNIKKIKFDIVKNNNPDLASSVLTSSAESALGFLPSFFVKINFNK